MDMAVECPVCKAKRPSAEFTVETTDQGGGGVADLWSVWGCIRSCETTCCSGSVGASPKKAKAPEGVSGAIDTLGRACELFLPRSQRGEVSYHNLGRIFGSPFHRSPNGHFI